MNNQMNTYRDHPPYASLLYKPRGHCQVAVLLSALVILLSQFAIPYASASTGQLNTTAERSFESRNLSFMRLSIDQGLAQAGINAIVQDQQGYIWLGTQEGLNRYDGHDVEIYEHEHNTPTSLSSDWIWSLLVDQQGVLWAGTDTGGLNRFDPETNSFTQFRHDPENTNSLSHDRVRVIYQDFNGSYWVGTDGGGLNHFNPETGQFVRYQHQSGNSHSLPNDSVLSILEDRSGNLWVGTKNGLSIMDRRTGQFVSFHHDPDSVSSLSGNQVRSLFEDNSGQLWIGTYEAGLNRYQPATGTFKHFQNSADQPHSLSHNRVRSIFQDSENTLWIATDNGLNQWLPDTEDFEHYRHNPTDPSSLSDNRLTTLYQDRGGVLWVGSFNGVNKWNYVSDAFSYYQKYGSQLKLSNNIVTTAMESVNHELFVGTYGGGLNRLNRLTGEVQHYRHNPANPSSLNDDRVMSVFIETDKVVWVGTRNGGLNRLDLETDSFSHYLHDPANPNSLSANGVTSILAEDNGTLWIGTYGGGLNKGHTNSDQFKSFRHDPNNDKTLSSNRILKIYRDRSGVLWIGTEDGGLNRFDEQNQSFVRYQHNPDDPESLGNNAAWDIAESSDGSFWIGTGGGGLNRWLKDDRDAGRAVFKSYRKSDGLHSDTVQAVLEDNAGYLWLSSNRGLQRFDPNTGEVREYDRSNGLKGNEFNTGARFKNHTGRLYFGGPTGLVAFHPNDIRSNQHQPDIVINAQTRLGPLNANLSDLPQQDADMQNSLNQAKTLKLGYQQDLITFEFTGLDYTAPEKNQYRFKLEGFDTDWTGPVSYKRTTYTNLPAGDYTFRVMASNNDGIWNEQGHAIKLQVIPPPWKTTWAFALYALIVISLIAAYLRAQAKKLRQEMEQRIYLEEQVQLRTQEIAERNEQLQGLNKQLKNASVTDTLTGLNNRRYLNEFIQAEVAQAKRQASAEHSNVQPLSNSLSFMMIDLDGFKAINDTYGHHAGDQALIQVRDILQGCCRQSDTIIRWGGDEFLIVSRNTSAQAVETLAERIRISLAEHLFQLGGGHTGRLSGSIGFALYPFSLQNPELVPWEQVVTIADRGAYVAKENGRNAWVGLYGTQTTKVEDLTRIKHELDQLIESSSLSLNTSIEGILHLGDKKSTQRDSA